MKKTEKNSEKTRRDFLKKGIKAGVASLVMPGIVNASNQETSEKIKMLAPDGSLVEIDRKLLASASSKRMATNDDIKNFVDHKKMNLSRGRS